MTRPTPASETHPIVSSTSPSARHTTSPSARHTAASKPLHIVASVVRVRAPRQTHTTSNRNMRRQATTRQATTRQGQRRQQQAATQRRQQQAAARQRQRRVAQQQAALRRQQQAAAQRQQQVAAQRRQQQAAARQRQRRQQRSAVRRGQQQTSARHTPVNKGSAARAGSALRVTWPAHATLRFDRPDVLRLATEPGASIAVTLQTIIRTRGVGGRELTLPYHTTTYATADRYGRVSIPLRYAYVPAQPTPATLIVVAHTAYGVSRRSASITLTR